MAVTVVGVVEEIPISDSGIRTFITISGVFLLVLCVGISILLGLIMQDGSNFKALLNIVTWLFLPIIWIISAWLAWARWKKEAYIKTKDTLIVRRGQIFGIKEDFYRYDSMLAVEVSQSWLSQRTNYGTVTITIPKLPSPILLNYVIAPETQVMNLKEKIMSSEAGSSSLVS